MAVLFDTLVFDIFLSMLMSMHWLLTIIASIALKVSLYQMVITIDRVESFALLIFPMSLCQLF